MHPPEAIIRLETSSGTQLDNPDADTIRRTLQQCLKDGEPFAVLSAGEERFVQMAGSLREGFLVECRDGDAAPPLVCARPPVDLETLVTLFCLFAAGDDSWRDLIAWKPLDPPPPAAPESDRTQTLIIVVLLIVLALWAVMPVGPSSGGP